MIIAATGLVAPALWASTIVTTLGISIGAFGIGALFVVASATALGQIGPEEAGIASGLLSTFHEFGAFIGVATVSTIAAAILATGGGGHRLPASVSQYRNRRRCRRCDLRLRHPFAREEVLTTPFVNTVPRHHPAGLTTSIAIRESVPFRHVGWLTRTWWRPLRHRGCSHLVSTVVHACSDTRCA